MPVAYGLIEPAELCIPHLPAELDGLRIAQISDLHVRRPSRRHERLAAQLTSHRFDLIVLTGDYMEDIGQEQAAMDVLRRLLEPLRPRLGTFGVFGNHDSLELRELCQTLPVTWLVNQRTHLAEARVELLGMDTHFYHTPDSVATVLNDLNEPTASPSVTSSSDEKPFRLLLAHLPSCLPTAADLGVDVLLAGHTHGGQCRLPGGRALYNSCDLPLSLSAGLLRHRHTLAGVSRGIGYAGPVPRFLCRPHVPVYTLRARDMPGQFSDEICSVQAW